MLFRNIEDAQKIYRQIAVSKFLCYPLQQAQELVIMQDVFVPTEGKTSISNGDKISIKYIGFLETQGQIGESFDKGQIEFLIGEGRVITG